VFYNFSFLTNPERETRHCALEIPNLPAALLWPSTYTVPNPTNVAWPGPGAAPPGWPAGGVNISGLHVARPPHTPVGGVLTAGVPPPGLAGPPPVYAVSVYKIRNQAIAPYIGGPAGILRNSLLLRIHNRVAPGIVAAAPGTFHAYYLPWETRGGMIYMTIPNPPLARFFFTAKLSGCSVFASGPQNNPTLYHCGIDSAAPFGVMAGGGPGVAGVGLGVTSQMIWHALVLHYRPAPVPMPPPGDIPQGVDKTDYQDDGITVGPGVPAPFVGIGPAPLGPLRPTTVRADALEQALRAAPPAGYGDNTATVEPMGAVFGRCDAANNWSFYLQEWAWIRFRRRRKAFWTRRRTGALSVNTMVNRPIQLTQFFPPSVPPAAPLPRAWDIHFPY